MQKTIDSHRKKKKGKRRSGKRKLPIKESVKELIEQSDAYRQVSAGYRGQQF